MVIRGSSHHDPTTASSKKLWDPSKTLGIINTDPGYNCITCTGYAPSQGRRCRNPIRADNRIYISDTLDELAYLQPNSAAVKSRLRSIVGASLCVRFHQSQAESILTQWQNKIQQLKPPRVPTTPVAPKVKEQSTYDDMEDLLEQLRDLQERIAARAAKQKAQEAKRLAKERAEQEAADKERAEEVRQEQERLAKERAEQEAADKERAEEVRQEQERLANEKRDADRREEERKAQNERIRQRAAKRVEERLKKEREEREAFLRSWARYQDRWTAFKACPSSPSSSSSSTQQNKKEDIPWPITSGLFADAKAGDSARVREFLVRGPGGGGADGKVAEEEKERMAKLMRKESWKWHLDSRNRLFGECGLGGEEIEVMDMISRVVSGLLEECRGK